MLSVLVPIISNNVDDPALEITISDEAISSIKLFENAFTSIL